MAYESPPKLRRARVSEVAFATVMGVFFMAVLEGTVTALFLDEYAATKSITEVGGFILLWAFVVFVIGLLPALLLGMPAYLLLDRFSRANYASMLLLGVIFATPMLLLTNEANRTLAMLLLCAPTLVALSTHWVVILLRQGRAGGSMAVVDQ